MPGLSSADHGVSPPIIHIPRDYNAAHDLIERNLLAGRAGKVVYIDDAGRYTYAELAQRANRAANALTGLGLEMESRIMLCHLDTIDFPSVFLGAIKAGIVPIAVNTLLTTGDYKFMLEDSRARALVVSEQLLPVLRAHSRQPAVPQARHRFRQGGSWPSAPADVDGAGPAASSLPLPPHVTTSASGPTRPAPPGRRKAPCTSTPV